MSKTIKVTLTDIKYKDNTKYLSVTGAGALDNFARGLGMNCYDAESAPTEWVVGVISDPDDIENILVKAQATAEEELGLQIESCRFRY